MMFGLWICMLLSLIFLPILTLTEPTSSSSTTTDPSIAAEASYFQQCKWSPQSTDFETLWVNMDRSVSRRISMTAHLDNIGLRHRRIKGLAMDKDIYVPFDVEKGWPNVHAVSNSTLPLPNRDNPEFSSYSVVVSGLFGRRKNNRLAEVGCTTSHLLAIRDAIYNSKSTANYALILEDDVSFPFNIDFDSLVKSAPPEWGIIQLFNSNEESMENNWLQYVKTRTLFIERYSKMAASYWSTCAYLVNKAVMRPIIDSIVHLREDIAGQPWWDVRILAATRNPCGPAKTECCVNRTIFQDQLAHCVFAPRGFQADSYLYAATRTFVLTVPLITNGFGGNQSTFHQSHVELFHQQAFMRQRGYMNKLITGEVPLPSFAKPACAEPLPIHVKVNIRPECVYTNHTTDPNYPPIVWIKKPMNMTGNRIMEERFRTVGWRVSVVPHIEVEELVMPIDVSSDWQTRECKMQSKAETLDTTLSRAVSFKDKAIAKWKENNRVIVVSGLCGRGKTRNTLVDLTETTSFLLAMHRAVMDTQSNSRYALIILDEVVIPFDMDLESLGKDVEVHAKNEPWAIAYLNTWSEMALERNWIRYVRSKKQAFIDFTHRLFDFWSLKVMLINRQTMREILSEIVQTTAFSPTSLSNAKSNGLIGLQNVPIHTFRVIATLGGSGSDCFPSECCGQSANPLSKACVNSFKGFNADRYIPSLNRSFIATLPFFGSDLDKLPISTISDRLLVDNTSAEHLVKSHERLRRYLNDLLQGLATPPSYITPACKQLLK